MIGTRKPIDRFALVTAAHHFLLEVLPFREPQSERALALFIAEIERIDQPSAEVDAVLLRCLTVLDTQHERRLPSLVDRYLASASTPEHGIAHFARCVRDLLRYRCITEGAVQQAVDLINLRYSESTLDARQVAETIGVRLSTLDVAFRRQMSCTMTDFIRELRLERAALLLATTTQTVKEIWVAVGYNHPSNFAHEFKRRFGMSSRHFRAQSILPIAQRHYGTRKDAAPRHDDSAQHGKRVLVIDDDECTRLTLNTYLTLKGYAVTLASTGKEGLRRLKQERFDMILLDYRLGDMNGMELLRTIRLESMDTEAPVAFFTADWDLFDQHEDVKALGASIVSKLCDLDQMRQAIQRLMERAVRPIALFPEFSR